MQDCEVRILVNGKPIHQYRDYSGNVWVEAHEGSSYSIEVKNNSYGRKLCVISVDGINVITGEPAEMKPKDGYVVDRYIPLQIEGWRISDSKVKEFVFTFNKNKSYACKLGEGKENLGVIGVLVYDEKPPVWYYNKELRSIDSIYKTSYDSGTPCLNDYVSVNCCASSIEMQAGTAKGKELQSFVTTTTFEESGSYQMYSIYYNSRAELLKAGIIKEKEHTLPQPFKPTKYCKDI